MKKLSFLLLISPLLSYGQGVPNKYNNKDPQRASKQRKVVTESSSPASKKPTRTPNMTIPGSNPTVSDGKGSIILGTNTSTSDINKYKTPATERELFTKGYKIYTASNNEDLMVEADLSLALKWSISETTLSRSDKSKTETSYFKVTGKTKLRNGTVVYDIASGAQYVRAEITPTHIILFNSWPVWDISCGNIDILEDFEIEANNSV